MVVAAPNFSTLPPLAVRALPGGRLSAGSNLTLSYNIIPGSANQMVGSRDVSRCGA
jgi:hypothetical protein